MKPPKIVREIDWVDNFWRFNAAGGGKDVKEKGRGSDSREGSEVRKEGSHLPEGDHVRGEVGEDLEGLKEKTNAPYPKVQFYCLVSSCTSNWTVRRYPQRTDLRNSDGYEGCVDSKLQQ